MAVYGTIGNDRITGTALADEIYGDAGNDTITGLGGNDTIYGADGQDQLLGGDGDDLIDGGPQRDYLQGDNGNDTLIGGAGDDWIKGGAGNDLIDGGAGDDDLWAEQGNDTVFGGDGNDDILGNPDQDFLYGDAGNDTIDAGFGDDLVVGGDGDDRLLGNLGDDTIDGGAGINNMIGDGGNDTFIHRVGASVDTVAGGAGTDTVRIELATAQLTDDMRAEFAALNNFMVQQLAAAGGSTSTLAAQTTGPSLTLATLGLTVSNVEQVTIVLDGQVVALSSLINDAPVAQSGVEVSTLEDTVLTGVIAATDPDGDALTFSLLQGPANGVLQLDAATGAYVYTPATNWNGGDGFMVRIADPQGLNALQWVDITVDAVNDAPVTASSATLTTNEDTSIVGEVAALDVEGDALSFSLATGPAHGTLQLDAETGAYTYNPAANWHGADSFTVRVADASGAFAEQTVAIAVAAVNDAPTTAASSAVATDEDAAISGQVVAADVDGDALSFSLATGPAHGTLQLDAATGAYTYNPAANWSGADSFTVRVADAFGAFAEQTVAIAVAAVNDAPTTAASSAVATDEDAPISGQVVAADVDGDTLSFSLATGPANGTLQLDAETGAYTYNPAANWHGADSFTVRVADASGAFAEQTVAIAVAAVNDAPVTASSATLTTNEDTSIVGEVAALDVDGDTLSFSLATGPANGTLQLDAETGAYTYNPAANWHGADSFTVRVADASGAFAEQTVAIAVAAVNDAPTTAAHSAVATDEDAPISGQVVAADVDGDALSFSLATGPAHGTLQLDAATGAYTYNPAANWHGADSFSVRVADASGAFAEQTVAIAVAAVADAPSLTVNAAVVNAPAGNAGLASISLNIAAALTDTDGSETLSIRISDLPADGVLSAGNRNIDGSWTVTAAQLPGLTFATAATGDFDLQVTALSTETTGATAATTARLSIHVEKTGINDIVTDGAGNNVIKTGAGNDIVIAGAGNDRYDGGEGFDTIDFSHSKGAVTVNLTSGIAVGLGKDVLVGFESVVGSRSDDMLIGSRLDDVFNGGAGDDRIVGRAGNDTLIGDAGDDVISGGSGNDRIVDGKGNDALDGGTGDDLFIAGQGNDDYNGGKGFDTIDFSAATGAVKVDLAKNTAFGLGNDKVDGIEKVIGTRYNDVLRGDSMANEFVGGAGNDDFHGRGGADVYTGGAGNDTYKFLKKDVYSDGVHQGVDTITDMAFGDKLDFSDVIKGRHAQADRFVQLAATTDGTMVAIKVDGAFQDAVLLRGVSLETATAWANDGMILG